MTIKKSNLSRRDFVIYSMSFLSIAMLPSCDRHSYVREEEQRELELDLGSVKSLLYNQVHIPIKSVLVMRDLDGWRALSSRCTYEGCDLTLQDQQQTLFCPCCKSAFDIQGRPLAGSKAKLNLPWMEIFYKEGNLYARPGKPVDDKYRFTDPKIEEAVRKLKLQIKEEKIADGTKIPQSLLGTADPEEDGPMFVDQQPDMAK